MKHQGFTIHGDPQSGFYWQEGGYFDTLAECHADIEDWNTSLQTDENIYGLPSIAQSIAEDAR